jgi:hypothetical protein
MRANRLKTAATRWHAVADRLRTGSYIAGNGSSKPRRQRPV